MEQVLDMEEYQKKYCKWSLNGTTEKDPHIHTTVYFIFLH